jgi:dihydroorotase
MIKVNDDGTIRAGVFMPGEIAISCLIDLIDYNDIIENFTSRYGAQFYQMPINDRQVEYIKESWIVPNDYNGIVPFMAGQQMNWRLAQ